MKLATLANKITFARLVFGGLPPTLILLFLNHSFYAMLACLVWVLFWEATDIADGIIARRNGEVSPVGKLLDPIADVGLHLPLLFALNQLGRVPWWVFLVIMIREFSVTNKRLILAVLDNGNVRGAKLIGKIKTWGYGVCICLETARLGLEAPDSPISLYLPIEISWFVFIAITAMGLTSWWVYGRNFKKKIKPLL